MISTLTNYLGYEFVRNALAAGTLAAILGAIVGYFVIVRNAGFAAHALAHIGFAGAAGAALLGLSTLEGMLLLTLGSSLVMGAAGDKLQRRDLAIGMVLSMSLGLGVLFLKLYSTYAGQAKSILFGDIFGVSTGQLEQMLVLSLLSLAALAVFSRRLLFASTQPRLAEARGLSLPGLSMAFMSPRESPCVSAAPSGGASASPSCWASPRFGLAFCSIASPAIPPHFGSPRSSSSST